MTGTHTSRTGTYPEEGIKAPCVVAATTNITLSGEQTINAVACVEGDRVAPTAQNDPTENGIWLCNTGAWIRPSDWSDARDVETGVFVPVPGGLYQATFTGEFVAGTTAITMTDMFLTSSAAAAAASAAAAADSAVDSADSATDASGFADDAEGYAVPSTQTITSAAGVVTIDVMGTYTSHSLTLTENVTSWSFTNLPASGKFRDHFVKIIQHASSAKTVTSPATSGRTAGGTWTVSSTVSSQEVLGIRVFSDGTKELYPSGVFG